MIKLLKEYIFPFTLALLVSICFIILSACNNDDETVELSQNTENIKIMSFNIRHDDDTDERSLDERKYDILEIITNNMPDIIGLQEFSDDWFESWLTTKLSGSGYGYYLNETESKGTPKVIFFKKERFICKDYATFIMNYTEFRSGTWVILADEVTSQDYFVCNSHWTTASSADRVKTATKILSEIYENYQDLPLIIIGDFNAKPGTDEISMLLGNDSIKLECSDIELQYTFNKWAGTGTKKIDWILHSNNFSVNSFDVIKTDFDGYWPSDHWPIMATLTYIQTNSE